ncbi:MAG: hypothetical protein JJE13_05895 [Thermoleophilia bacterium]|nr:hypothetical protein [Thermoleophilia bacterium]
MAGSSPLDAVDPGRAKSLKGKIKDRLDDAGRHLDALGVAMSGFGSGFDLVEFRAAFDSKDPDQLNSVKAVERGSEQLYNYIAELTRFGLELSTNREPSDEMNARRDFVTLRDIGVITGMQEARLQSLRELRRNLVHEYPGISAAQVHEAAVLVSQEFRPFIRSYGAWVKQSFAKAMNRDPEK